MESCGALLLAGTGLVIPSRLFSGSTAVRAPIRTATAGRLTARRPAGITLGGPISAEPRINDRIRVPEVRLVGPDGQQVGIVAIQDALRLAQEADLDLVEIVPTGRPPVAKLMDYGKYKYESAMKAREARKNQAHTIIKEMKLRPKIDPHDYETKKGHVVRFLNAGDKVKITIMFRGREQSRPELGRRLLDRLASDVEDLGFVEFAPKQDGRNMIMVLGPRKKKVEAMAEARAAKAAKAESDSRTRDREDFADASGASESGTADGATTQNGTLVHDAADAAVQDTVVQDPAGQ
jgi:translation initiation factor IF-3